VEDLAVHGSAVDCLPVIKVERHGGCSSWLEAEVNIENAEKATEEQARGDKENAGEGDLRDNESSAEAGRSLAAGGAGSRILERVLQVAAGGTETGNDAEEESGDDGDEAR